MRVLTNYKENESYNNFYIEKRKQNNKAIKKLLKEGYYVYVGLNWVYINGLVFNGYPHPLFCKMFRYFIKRYKTKFIFNYSSEELLKFRN